MGEIVPAKFTQHATRATDYLLLAAICRVTVTHSSTLPSAECTAAARTSLHEHTTCITLLISYDDDPALFEPWINAGLILFPFMPFNIIFYSVIETGNLADLESLKALVNALELLSKKPSYTSCAKQLEIFRALYTVALVHGEVRGQSQVGHHPSDSMPSCPKDAVQDRFVATPDRLHSEHNHKVTSDESLILPAESHILESWPSMDFGVMDLDPLGTQLGYWIQGSNQL